MNDKASTTTEGKRGYHNNRLNFIGVILCDAASMPPGPEQRFFGRVSYSSREKTSLSVFFATTSQERVSTRP